MGLQITTHKELRVYQKARELALEIYEISKAFPDDEKFSLTSQIRRSSRSVCANIGEAWRKRRYEKSFVAKLSDAETEAAETQVWLEFASAHRYIGASIERRLDEAYDHVLAQIVLMAEHPEKWTLPNRHR